MRGLIENKKFFFFVSLGILLIAFPVLALELNWPPSPGGIQLTDATTLTGMVKYFYEWGIALGGLAAFIALIIAGFQYLTSMGDPGKIKEARDRISSAVLGLVLLLSSFLILNTINPELTTLKMPEVGSAGRQLGYLVGSSGLGPCEKVVLYTEPYFQGQSYELTPEKKSIANGCEDWPESCSDWWCFDEEDEWKPALSNIYEAECNIGWWDFLALQAPSNPPCCLRAPISGLVHSTIGSVKVYGNCMIMIYPKLDFQVGDQGGIFTISSDMDDLFEINQMIYGSIKLIPLVKSDIKVSAFGEQVPNMSVGAAENNLGGGFAIAHKIKSKFAKPGVEEQPKVTAITVSLGEEGTVELNKIKNIKLYYELSFPFLPCLGYDGNGRQFGDSVDEFSSDKKASFFMTDAEGKITGVRLEPGQTMCVYVVFDVDTGAQSGQAIEIEISNPPSEVGVSQGAVIEPASDPEKIPVEIPGSTIIR